MAISDELTKLEANRANIVAAINSKGGELAENAGLAACPEAIAAIKSGGFRLEGTGDDMFHGFFSVSGYNVGTEIDMIQPMSSNDAFRCEYMLLNKGMKLTIYGMGGSFSSRLYMIVSKSTKKVTAIATLGEDRTEEPFVVEINQPSYIYITMTAYEGNINYICKYIIENL